MTSKAERKKSIQKWALWLAIATLVAAGIIYLLIWYGPDVIARHDIGSVTGSHRAAALQVARDAARGRLLTLGAGLFAAGALIFTARNLILYRRTNEIAEQGQVTDRYTKAIEQLGSDKLDVRIGGIYALERIARDSARDHPDGDGGPGRVHPRALPRAVAAARARREHAPSDYAPRCASRHHCHRAPGLQRMIDAADRSCCRGPRPARTSPARTSPARTSPARTLPTRSSSAQTSPARPSPSRTSAVRTSAMRPSAARISPARPSLGADLTGADLTGATFIPGDHYLPGDDHYAQTIPPARIIYEHNMTNVDVFGADLTNANLTGATLTNANLTDANLTGVIFTDADLSGATYPKHEPVPWGWVQAPGAGLRRANEEPGKAGPDPF